MARTLMTLQAFTGRYLPALESEMRAVVTAPSKELHDLYGYLHYHLGWVDEHLRPTEGRSGKRLRPVICLLACEGCGGDWRQALPAAAAVELLHNFSLIHDDIQDGDTTRRGRPTVWALWGMPQALNAGDALYALAHLALLRLAERGVPPGAVAVALRRFSDTCVRLTEGQFLDIRFESREDITPQAYMQMVEGKTSALLAASCALGPLVAGAPADQCEQLSAYGHHLGLAFQIQDDILGIWGDPQVTGKPVGADLLRRKKTLPIIHGLERSQGLRSLLSRADFGPTDAAQAAELLEKEGSREWAGQRAQEQTNRALAALDAADLREPTAGALRNLALGLASRTS